MLWGGRFSEKIDDKALEFSSSLSYDIALFDEDIKISIAHAKMLSETGIISTAEFEIISKGLLTIKQERDSGKWTPDPAKSEDIHSAIEEKLKEIIGPLAGKLHSGRSRNDQVATGFRMWVKKSCLQIISEICDLQNTMLSIAEENIETVIPGYTHLQRAQPVSLAFHFLAYTEMLKRDVERIKFTFSQADKMPLGSGAIAGSTLPLNREVTKKELDFAFITENAMDSISDRDFALDFLNSCVIGMMHLSRLSEELIIWSSAEWGLAKIGDKFTTGSSLMPQKKNPDIAELIRGKSGRVYGNYISLATTMKGLPLSYNRDMQEDKEPVFDSFSTYSNSLVLMSGMLATIKFDNSAYLKELDGDFSLSTDLADWLVLKGIPFRDAHHIVGQVVKIAEEKNTNFKGLSLSDLKNINPVFDETALDCLKLSGCLQRKVTYGSPNIDFIKKRIKNFKKEIKIYQMHD